MDSHHTHGVVTEVRLQMNISYSPYLGLYEQLVP